MTYYIPVNTILREGCQEFHKNSIPFDGLCNDYIDDPGVNASFTEMNEACKKGDENCKYILKVATYNYGYPISLRQYFTTWHNEATILYKLNSYQNEICIKFSPYLYDWWYVHKGSEVHFYSNVFMEILLV